MRDDVTRVMARRASIFCTVSWREREDEGEEEAQEDEEENEEDEEAHSAMDERR